MSRLYRSVDTNQPNQLPRQSAQQTEGAGKRGGCITKAKPSAVFYYFPIISRGIQLAPVELTGSRSQWQWLILKKLMYYYLFIYLLFLFFLGGGWFCFPFPIHTKSQLAFPVLSICKNEVSKKVSSMNHKVVRRFLVNLCNCMYVVCHMAGGQEISLTLTTLVKECDQEK